MDELQTRLHSIIRLHSCELLRRMLQEANAMVPAVAGTDGGDIKIWAELLADELAGRKDGGTKGTTLPAIRRGSAPRRTHPRLRKGK